MIPMSNINIPDIEIPEVKIKSNYIIRMLFDYDVEDARDAIRIIEEQGVDKFQFDYPYGSFEEYKKHVLAGEFDLDIKSVLTSPEEQKELDKAVKEGKVWVTYESERK